MTAAKKQEPRISLSPKKFNPYLGSTDDRLQAVRNVLVIAGAARQSVSNAKIASGKALAMTLYCAGLANCW